MFLDLLQMIITKTNVLEILCSKKASELSGTEPTKIFRSEVINYGFKV